MALHVDQAEARESARSPWTNEHMQVYRTETLHPRHNALRHTKNRPWHTRMIHQVTLLVSPTVGLWMLVSCGAGICPRCPFYGSAVLVQPPTRSPPLLRAATRVAHRGSEAVCIMDVARGSLLSVQPSGHRVGMYR